MADGEYAADYDYLSRIPITNKEQLGQSILKVDSKEERDKEGYLVVINEEIAKSFLSVDQYDLYLDLCDYCETVKSFAMRYGLNLVPHHDHLVRNISSMVSGSGAVEGQRVTLAKTDIAKTVAHQDSVQTLQQKSERQRTDILSKVANRI